MRRPIRIAVGAVVIVAALAGLTACSAKDKDSDPSPTSSSSDGATEGSAESWTAKDLAAAMFEAPATSGSLATVTGAVPSTAKPNPASIEVTEVRASATSTLVRFTLRNVDDSNPTVHPEGFNADSPATFDIRGITLVDTAAKLRLQPYIGRLVNELTMGEPLCACSDAPLQMSKEGQLLSAIFPPLAASSTTVTLELTGFPLLENLAVTRD